MIEAINKVGSAFYGPVLATFVLGLATRRVGGRAMLIGLVAGVAINLTAWLSAWPLHWMWWNVMGFGVTAGGAWVLSLDDETRSGEDLPIARWRAAEVGWATPLLAGGFLLTLGLVMMLG